MEQVTAAAERKLTRNPLLGKRHFYKTVLFCSHCTAIAEVQTKFTAPIMVLVFAQAMGRAEIVNTLAAAGILAEQMLHAGIKICRLG